MEQDLLDSLEDLGFVFKFRFYNKLLTIPRAVYDAQSCKADMLLRDS